jgi:hypothetical protein
VVPALTISDEERLKLKLDGLQNEVKNLRTLDAEVAQKDKEIREMKVKMQAMQHEQDEIRELLKHPEKIRQAGCLSCWIWNRKTHSMEPIHTCSTTSNHILFHGSQVQIETCT